MLQREIKVLVLNDGSRYKLPFFSYDEFCLSDEYREGSSDNEYAHYLRRNGFHEISSFRDDVMGNARVVVELEEIKQTAISQESPGQIEQRQEQFRHLWNLRDVIGKSDKVVIGCALFEGAFDSDVLFQIKGYRGLANRSYCYPGMPFDKNKRLSQWDILSKTEGLSGYVKAFVVSVEEDLNQVTLSVSSGDIVCVDAGRVRFID